MSERKVLNKYYPVDFDPAKIPRRKMAADRQQVVRLMAPYSMRCNTCGEYIYKGKKFNARKETVQNETYYGIRIFRFYIKCTRCSAEITFKTDPKNTDYVAEHGASRNFEPWRDTEGGSGEGAEEADADPLAHLIEEEEGGKKRDAELDPMKALEARTLESKREMEVLDALQDIQTRNARNERADTGAILDHLAAAGGKGKGRMLDPEELERKKQEEEDELLVRKYFSRAEDVLPEELDRDPIELDESVAPSEPVPSGSGSGSAADAGVGAKDGVENGTDAATHAASTSNGAVQTKDGKRPNGVAVKRQFNEIEPDVTSLLSERAKALVSATSTLPPSLASRGKVAGASALPSTNGVAKKKQKGNAFGLVRKK
ncbi:hypothetical protein V8E36_003539 [Tilletia maclaganii]